MATVKDTARFKCMVIRSLFCYCVMVLSMGSVVYGQSATKSLSDLQGLEASRDRANSPSQVVILNNSPSSSQEQDSDQRTRTNAKQYWGDGGTLEYLKNNRMREEIQNEQALLEKLEESRVEDERSRLERLFRIREYNQRQWKSQPQPQQNYVQEYVQDPVVIVQPDAVSVNRNTPNKVAYTSASTSSGQNHWYIRGQYGVGSYRANNSESSASIGFALGRNTNSRTHLEFSFLSSHYTIDDPRGNSERDYYGDTLIEPSDLRSLQQSNFTGVLGYDVLESENLRGALRLGLSYVQRHSESSKIANFNPVSTDAVDFVIGGSLDLDVGNNWYAMGTFDLFSNLTNDIFEDEDEFFKRVEISRYYIVGVGIKYQFH